MNPNKTKFPDRPNSLNAQDQTEAHLFVGKFISTFANLEAAVGQAIIAYLFTDISLSTQRRQEIADKNTSMLLIMEHSVLGSPYLNFQTKVDMLKAIMQEGTPEFYTKHGKKLFKLITLMQRLRNLIAHYKTYIDNGSIHISKPTAIPQKSRGKTQKGGVVPDVIEYYVPIYDTQIITKDMSDIIPSQLSYAANVIQMYTMLKLHKGTPKIISEKSFESFLDANMFQGGVDTLKILKVTK